VVACVLRTILNYHKYTARPLYFWRPSTRFMRKLRGNDMEKIKRCISCKRVLLDSELHKDCARKDGLGVYCKTCKTASKRRSMKIYWKNLLWNYTVRLWYCWKYRNSKFWNYYCSERYVTERQRQELLQHIVKRLTAALSNIPYIKIKQQSIQRDIDSDTE
jgi:hypothetical protein